MEYKKPLPIPNEDSRPFFDGCKEHVTLLQKCEECGTIRFPPSNMCPSCLSEKFTLEKMSGEGTIYSFVIANQALRPGWKDDIPFVPALVELKEKVRVFTNIVDCNPSDVAIGKPVKAVFDDVTDDITLLKFKLA